MKRAGLVALSAAAVLAAIACTIPRVEVHAASLQEANCADGLARLADAGSDPRTVLVRADLQACVCGARGTLARNGGAPDAGRGPCPQ